MQDELNLRLLTATLAADARLGELHTDVCIREWTAQRLRCKLNLTENKAFNKLPSSSRALVFGFMAAPHDTQVTVLNYVERVRSAGVSQIALNRLVEDESILTEAELATLPDNVRTIAAGLPFLAADMSELLEAVFAPLALV